MTPTGNRPKLSSLQAAALAAWKDASATGTPTLKNVAASLGISPEALWDRLDRANKKLAAGAVEPSRRHQWRTERDPYSPQKPEKLPDGRFAQSSVFALAAQVEG
jgi:hypothetical protein